MTHTSLSRRQFFAVSGAAAVACASGAAPAAHTTTTSPRVAVVGCGFNGMRHLRQLQAAESRARITAVCDIDQAALARAVSVSEAPEYREWWTLLDQELDAVVVATPAGVREEMLDAFLGSGKHVFCETPWDISELPGHAAGLCLAAPLHSHGARAWSEVRQVFREGHLGRPRWSQVHVQPLARPTRGAWVRQFAEAVLPALALHIDEEASSVAMIGTAGKDSAYPATYSAEVCFSEGHTLHVLCTRANPTGVHPLLRGRDGSLEIRGGYLHVHRETSPSTQAAIAVPADSPLQQWLNQACCRQPDSDLSRLMLRAEALAACALETCRA